MEQVFLRPVTMTKKVEEKDERSMVLTLPIWIPQLLLKEDFFRYVNGAWLDSTEIPNDRTRWGSFDELRQRTDEDALALLGKDC